MYRDRRHAGRGRAFIASHVARGSREKMPAVLPRCLTLLLIALSAAPARAAHLPFRAYGAAEGLAGDHVRFLLQDTRGFLWLATNAGVSRFDGHDFRNFGTTDGLPFTTARKVIEARDGTLYFLGAEKLARRRATPGPQDSEFEAVESPDLERDVGDIFDAFAAADGSLLVAGSKGVARLRGERVEAVDLGPMHLPELADARIAWAAAVDGDGTMWVARTYGITRIGRDGKPSVLPLSRERIISSGWGWLPSMTLDRSGRVWLLTVESGAWRLAADGDGRPAIAEVID